MHFNFLCCRLESKKDAIAQFCCSVDSDFSNILGFFLGHFYSIFYYEYFLTSF